MTPLLFQSHFLLSLLLLTSYSVILEARRPKNLAGRGCTPPWDAMHPLLPIFLAPCGREIKKWGGKIFIYSPSSSAFSHRGRRDGKRSPIQLQNPCKDGPCTKLLVLTFYFLLSLLVPWPFPDRGLTSYYSVLQGRRDGTIGLIYYYFISLRPSMLLKCFKLLVSKGIS